MEDSHSQEATLTPAAEAVLARAWDDWVSLGEAKQVVSEVSEHATAAELREDTIRTVALLLERNLARAGDVLAGFVAWDLDPAAAITRVRGGWTDPEARLLPGDVCWLAGTAAGLAVGDGVLARREEQNGRG